MLGLCLFLRKRRRAHRHCSWSPGPRAGVRCKLCVCGELSGPNSPTEIKPPAKLFQLCLYGSRFGCGTRPGSLHPICCTVAGAAPTARETLGRAFSHALATPGPHPFIFCFTPMAVRPVPSCLRGRGIKHRRAFTTSAASLLCPLGRDAGIHTLRGRFLRC